MAQEDYNHTTTSGGGGNIGRSSRRQKKVPQRGLGVAQLEKIRIEELQNQKKDVAAALVGPSILPAAPNHISQGTVPLVNPSSSDVTEFGRYSDAIAISGTVQSMSTLTHLPTDLETTAVEPSYALHHNWNLQCEPDPVWPPPAGPIPRAQRDYLNQVHVGVMHSTASTTSSSSLNYPMEPPSNQNFHHGYYVPVAPEVVGMKRPDPFSIETPLVPLPLLSGTAHQIGRSNDLISHGNMSISIHKPSRGNYRNEYRNGLSLTGSKSEQDANSARGYKENGIIGEVLTLGPPPLTSSSTWPNPSHMDPAPNLTSFNHSKLYDIDPQGQPNHHQPFHGEDEVECDQQGSIRPGEQHQYYYNFILAPLIPRVGRADTSLGPNHRTDEEAIDLELKL